MRVAYWTTASLQPGIEAVSKEVFELAANFKSSFILGVNPNVRLHLGRRPLHIGFNSAFDPLLRAFIPLMERRVDVNHVYSEISPWLFHKTLGRKPIILTIASERGDIQAAFLDRARAITVQTETLRKRLSEVAHWRSKVSLLYPGVDLEKFLPDVNERRAASHAAVRILFATFPRSREELEPRGVYLLVDLARQLPGARFDVLTRPWGRGETAYRVMQERVRESGLGNIRLLDGRRENMQDLYRDYDFTVIPYLRPDGGKECPLSLVEGLACGVPVLISSAAPFAPFVAEKRCGAVFDPNPRSFVATLDRALADYQACRLNAVECARTHFDRNAVFQRFEALYNAATP